MTTEINTTNTAFDFDSLLAIPSKELKTKVTKETQVRQLQVQDFGLPTLDFDALLATPDKEPGKRGRKPGIEGAGNSIRTFEKVNIKEVTSNLFEAMQKSCQLLGIFYSLQSKLQNGLLDTVKLDFGALRKCYVSPMVWSLELVLGVKELASYASITPIPWALHSRAIRGAPSKNDSLRPFVERSSEFWTSLETLSYETQTHLFVQDPSLAIERLQVLQFHTISTQGRVGKSRLFNIENKSDGSILSDVEFNKLISKVATQDLGLQANNPWPSIEDFLTQRQENLRNKA
jgi:hypothetical protein